MATKANEFLFETFKVAVPVLILLFLCCGLPLMFVGPPNKPALSVPIEQPGIKYVASTRDQADNLMFLYTVDKGVQREQLVAFCEKFRAEPQVCNFLIAAFFREGGKPQFPSVAVYTGGYGLDDDQVTDHIIGEYTFQKLNGYSTLRYFRDGYTKSKADEIRIP